VPAHAAGERRARSIRDNRAGAVANTSIERGGLAPLTKFRVPRERRDTIERQRVLAALRASHAVLWIPLDHEDDDPNRFHAARWRPSRRW
jgi:hypothetical protein